MKTMKFLQCLLVGGMATLLVSCGMTNAGWMYRVSSHGMTPANKTFTIVAVDEDIQNTLEFAEYSNLLKARLRDAGYKSDRAESAALRIELDYGVGANYLAAQAKTFAHDMNARLSGVAGDNETCVVRYTGTSGETYVAEIAATGSAYTVENVPSAGTGAAGGGSLLSLFTGGGAPAQGGGMPAFVTIRAFDAASGRAVWEVTVTDNLQSAGQLPAAMPWMLVCAQNYFGKSSTGEQIITVEDSPSFKQQYNLVWPYNPQPKALK